MIMTKSCDSSCSESNRCEFYTQTQFCKSKVHDVKWRAWAVLLVTPAKELK